MKAIRKTLLNTAGAVVILMLAGVLFAACAGPFEPEQGNDDGKGYVRVSIAPDATARTMLPNALQLYYTLTFTNTDGLYSNVNETLGGSLQKTVALLPGTYTLVVQGYRSPYDAENSGTAVLNGSSAGSFVVGTGTNPDVEVTLTATQSGTGTLRYTLEYPTNPAVSGGRIYVEQVGGPYTKLITPTIDSYYGSANGTIPNLSAGFYQVTVYLSNGRTAIKSDLAHIYDDLETEAKFMFDLSSFADVADLSPLTTAIVAARAVAETAARDVRISADGTGITAGHTWVSQANLDALNTAIAAAELVAANYGAGLADAAVNAAATALNGAVVAFNTACTTVGGSYTPSADIGLYVGSATSPESAAGTTLASALDWLQTNATSDTAYAVLLGDDETLPPWTLGGYYSGATTVFNGLTGVTLTLKGEAERIIQLGTQGSLFNVSNGVTLILDQNITLRGRADNNTSLVYISSGGAVEMNAGAKITGNTSSSYGGGVYVSGGTFTMNDGAISGNTSSSSGYSSSSYGGGVCVYYNGTFTLKGSSSIARDNPVYLERDGTNFAVVTIDGAVSGTDPVAFIELPADLTWIGREVIKKSASFAGILPADRFGFAGPWEADSNGKARPKAGSLGFGETRSAFINRGDVHLYRFTPAFNKSYTITITKVASEYNGGNSTAAYLSTAWADGSGTLVNSGIQYYETSTTTLSFVATKSGVDVIIMVDSSNYAGAYSVKYNELE
jgi:hypothetical protein